MWGGDGMVQRCVDVLAGSEATLAIIPAGTANLLATNLGIPKDIEAGGRHRPARARPPHRRRPDQRRALRGDGRRGFDARMIGDADGGLKDRFGRLAYVWTGAKHLREKPFRAKIEVDGARWYDGEASCILLGNVGKLFGGVEAFEDAHPDDGVLELGVVSADGIREWAGTVARAVVGTAEQVAARLHDEGALGPHQARSQGAVRDRRRRPQEGAQAARRGRAGGRDRSACRPRSGRGSGVRSRS